ncbi:MULTISPECIES: ion channel [Cupriavidus]
MQFSTHDLLALLCASVLTVMVVVIHYEALRLLSAMSPHRWSGRVNVGVLILCIIVAHCLEAIVFGAGYWVAGHVLGLGGLGGPQPVQPITYIYFSLETYTTQSLGDISPIGATRLIASIEPLVGLILIGWSTSFTYIIMRRDWPTAVASQATQGDL